MFVTPRIPVSKSEMGEIDGGRIFAMDSLNTLIAFFQVYGYFAVFGILIVCGFGVPIPEDITLVAGGIICGLGYGDVHIMVVVVMVGVLVGDGTMFSLGRYFGPAVLENRFFSRLVTPNRYQKVQKSFEKHGRWVLFFARFAPGLRSAIFLTAGFSRRVDFWRFIATDGFAALISVPLWVYAGYFGAHERDQLLSWLRKGEEGVTAILVIAGVGVALYLLWRNRRPTAQDGH